MGKGCNLMKAKHSLALSVAIAALAGVAAANAAPVTYDYTSGFVTVSAFQGGSNTDLLAAGTELQLSGGQVTFDSIALTLPSFQFLDNTSQTFTVVAAGAFKGEQITVQSWNAVPGAGYSSSAFLSSSPPPTYGFTAGPIAASGMYFLTGPPITQASKSFAGTTNSLTGQVTLSGTDMIQLTGITLGVINLSGGQTITLKGDVMFEGATPVPLPASVWLLSSAIALFGLTLVDRRRISVNQWKI
jgi:hypothetical protein